jgi:hypothetical protein
LPVAPNPLARNLTAERPDQVWLADLSDIPAGAGRLSLAAVRNMWRPPDRRRADAGALRGRPVRRRPAHGDPALPAGNRTILHGDRDKE